VAGVFYVKANMKTIIVILFTFFATTIWAQSERKQQLLTDKLAEAQKYYELGARLIALEMADSATIIAETTKLSPSTALAELYILKTHIYYDLSLLEYMPENSAKAYKIYQQIHPNKDIFRALHYGVLSRYYNHKNKMDSASFFSEEALKILNNNRADAALIDDYLIYMFHASTMRNRQDLSVRIKGKYLSNAYSDSAIWYCNKKYPENNFKKARLYHATATTYLDFANDKNYSTNPAEAESNFNSAITYYSKAVKIYDSISGYHNVLSAHCNTLTGLLYFYRKDYRKAIECYDQTIKRLTANPENLLGKTLNYEQQITAVLKLKNLALQEIYNQNQQKEVLLKIIENLKISTWYWDHYVEDALIEKKKPYRDNYSLTPYNALASAYLNLYESEKKEEYLQEAFLYSEKHRYPGVYYALLLEKNHFVYEDKKLIDSEKACKIYFEKLLLKQNNKLMGIEANETKYLALWNQYLKEKNAPIAKARKERQYLTLDEVQKKLKNDEAALYYIITEHQTEAWMLLINKNKLSVKKLNHINESNRHEPLADSLLQSIQQSDFRMYKRASFVFYESFFKMAENELQGIRKIELFPFSRLANVPFEALISDTLAGNYKDLQYLSNRFIFRYSLSATISAMQETAKKEKNSILAIYPAYPDSNYSLMPFSGRAFNELKEKYPGTYIKGSDATKDKVLTEISKAKIIQLFAHSLGLDDPDKSKIILTDSTLLINDLYDIKIKANLAVLSSCQSGVGEVEHGEGIVNFTRSFIGAGAKSVVATFWKVDDQSTAEIILLFYQYLNKGLPKDEALHQAKKNFLKANPSRFYNPLYWAGLYLTGNNDALQLDEKKENHQKYFLLGTFFLIVPLFWLYRKKFWRQ
jgi:CHAT domain-containing protein